ncbi:MAG: TAXI family TRAP transporter solute-binding subunit [Rhodospirillaceae bacterium]
MFCGLKNLRVAIPIEGTAGFDAFWFLAKHFGIEPGDIQMFSGTNSATQWLFEDGTVDAVFRVSPAGDPRLRSLVASQQARQIPIPQSDALALQWPSLQHVIIPQGAYQGLPAVPLTDTETVGIGRLLLAHSDAPTEAVFMLTSAIFENRRELIDRTPLAGFIAPPDQLAVYAPIHDGAREYFERDAPGFLQEYAEPLALFVSLIILIGTIVVHFSGRAARRRIERYNRKLLDLSHRARSADSFEQLDDCDTQLGQFVDHIILDFELGLISPNDFTVFQFTFTAAEDAIRDRASQLKRAAKGDLSAFLSSAANPLGVGSDVAFDLTKDFSDDTDAEGRR